ncbi:hypothetical protein [Geothrix sp. 21YS21S-4]|uniref:hypothetical protein n=1 Tax=Geothrix sp. 21YS21S-4 TaxID=3068889 RepID=UPI0027B8E346|nr:hypothetical protein [Geothrix sp. 21YS21S-4]
MRFVPLISSRSDPGEWVAAGAVALAWDGDVHGGWGQAVRRGMAIPAIHLPQNGTLEEGVEALGWGLNPDFLVLCAPRPATREEGFRLLGRLEALLEAASGRGTKLALRIEGGAEAEVADLLRQARAEAVGFCWHPATADVDALVDRLWCGVCEPSSDLRPLQRLGYRWDMALPARDPEAFRREATVLEVAHPPVLFPADLPPVARPAGPEGELVFGRHWNSEGRP